MSGGTIYVPLYRQTAGARMREAMRLRLRPNAFGALENFRSHAGVWAMLGYLGELSPIGEGWLIDVPSVQPW